MQEIKNVKGASMINQAVDMLTAFILESGIKTGDYLPTEQELGKQLGVGRSTLREAVKALESKGLVKRLHGQGVQVVDESRRAVTDMLLLIMKKSGSTVEELTEASYFIEVKAAGLAAERATPADLATIKAALQIMQAEAVTAENYILADHEFHLAIATAAHNMMLPLMLATIRPMLHEAIAATLEPDAGPKADLRYHEKIFSAIEKGNKHKASKAMKAHLREVHEVKKAGKK